MEKKQKYEKPLMVAESFIPNDFIAGCTMTVSLAGSAHYHVYHDNGDGYYQSGEELVANYQSPITIDIQENETAGYLTKAKYAATGIQVGDYILVDLSKKNYYISYYSRTNKYDNVSAFICALKATNGTTYYYNQQRITNISNKNAS